MKICSKCKAEKPRSEFWKKPGSKDGLRTACKSCMANKHAAWVANNGDRKKAADSRLYCANKQERCLKSAEYYEANKERILSINKTWREVNAEQEKERKRLRRLTDGDRIRAKRREHYAQNKSRYVANARRREMDQLKRTPAWADLNKIADVYAEAARITAETGIKHHVDHFYPLRGKTCSGLHVEDNLQVIPWRDNLMKANKHPEVL